MGKRKPAVCKICDKQLTRDDRKWAPPGLCLDCAITYHGGAAHQMAEGIRAQRRGEQETDKPAG